MAATLAAQVEDILAERGSDWDLDYGQVQVMEDGVIAKALLMKVRGDWEARRWVVVNLDEDDVIDIHV